MSVNEPSVTSVRRRWVKPVLVVSLALNLVFVGLVAGAVWKRGFGGWGGPKHKVFEAAIVQLITELPAGKRKTAEQVLSRLRSEVLPRAQGHRPARRRAIEALTADPFSEDKFRSALAEVRGIRAGIDEGMHELAVELVRALSVTERQRLVAIYHSKKRARRGWWKRSREDRRP